MVKRFSKSIWKNSIMSSKVFSLSRSGATEVVLLFLCCNLEQTCRHASCKTASKKSTSRNGLSRCRFLLRYFLTEPETRLMCNLHKNSSFTLCNIYVAFPYRWVYTVYSSDGEQKIIFK